VTGIIRVLIQCSELKKTLVNEIAYKEKEKKMIPSIKK
jgi:hypothetical protein